MNDMQITDLVSLCSQWWPNWRAPESLPVMVKSWRMLLGDLDFDAGLAALSVYASEEHAFPPPVGILRRNAARMAMPGGTAPTVDEAWAEVLAEISRVGLGSEYPGGRTPTFAHPATETVVYALGWRQLCESDNQVADRAHFAKMYSERVERDVSTMAEAPNVIATRRALADRVASNPRVGTNPVSVGESIAAALPERTDA